MDEKLSQLVDQIYQLVTSGHPLTSQDFLRLQHRYRRDDHAAQPFYTKAEILDAVTKSNAWTQLANTERQQLRHWLRVKPIRTSSGVATVTILTKPWPCPGECRFCPSDLRMPKSYLANEPGAQRAESHWFDPFLQVTSRLEALQSMGHPLDKVEIIILGGSWDAYPQAYRLWFVSEVYRALNLFGTPTTRYQDRTQFYQDLDTKYSPHELVLSNNAALNAERVGEWQKLLDSSSTTYNELVITQFLDSSREKQLQNLQTDTWDTLAKLQADNAHSRHRNVGLVIETRPDLITETTVQSYRRLGCTKIQLGIQSVDEKILAQNGRPLTRRQIATALAWLRLYGFKIHAHFMANLVGATPEADILDFRDFVTTPDFLPDEIKLYPCNLLAQSPLVRDYQSGRWQPYTESQLLEVLVAAMTDVPPYMRISRMIRDFSATDIVAGNKKTNFRQLVDDELARWGIQSADIRSREIGQRTFDPAQLRLDEICYQTSITTESFLQWVTPENRIVGFLRLSLPDEKLIHQLLPTLHDDWGLLRSPVAMIREVHVYGQVSPLQQTSNTQHLGLGKKLIARAEAIAREKGFTGIRVIAAVGTREYYEKLGFREHGFYHEKKLV